MSTYSPDLRIELITTGDQAGVWGNTTNNNLAYVVEQAIAGYVSVSVISANQALTYLNGGSSTAAANQAVHAAIALTTTTGANFAVYAPPASKQYTIYNASAYTATIYNSTVIGNTTAAGTGVAIPAGKTTTVWSDGTNFALQNGIATTPSPGTNDVSIATTAFVQAALGPIQAALYPVGSIYTSTVSTNPNTLFGFGTWVAFSAGRVLIGNGGGYTAGATGGSADAIVVSHTHTGNTGGQSNDHVHGASTSISDPGHRHSIGGNAGGAVQVLGLQSGTAAGIGPGSAGNYVDDYAGTPIIQNRGTGISASTSIGGVSANHTHGFTTDASGSSGTNANLQPYIVVYMWQRTA
jgi:hypothetical protein